MASKVLLALALGAALLLSGPTGFGPQETFAQGCLPDGAVRDAVAAGQARPFSQFSGRLKSMGKVVSWCLVDQGGSYAYVGSILQANGQVTKFAINAKSGQ
jgi:hypothetical protein